MASLNTISLGAGIQSTTMALLAVEGTLPKPDAAIFADTGWEPSAVYETVDRLEQTLGQAGIPLYRVGRGGSIREDVLDRHIFATLPAYTVEDVEIREPLVWHVCQCYWGELIRRGVPYDALLAVRDLAPISRDDLSNQAKLFEHDAPDHAAHLNRVALALHEDDRRHLPRADERCEVGRVITSWHTYTKQVKGTIKRQCTGKYKIEPVEKKNRELLGAPVWMDPCRYCQATGARIAPWDVAAGTGVCSVCRGTGQRRRVGSVPEGNTVTQWIGFSTDEITRVTTKNFPDYATPYFPLIDLGMSRDDCAAYLVDHGWKKVAKSACVGCPFHRNDFWRDMRDNRPREWADAVEFDRAFRTAPGLNARRYLHESCRPLDKAPIGRPTRLERANAQGNLLDLIVVGDTGERSCSPYSCPSSEEDAA